MVKYGSATVHANVYVAFMNILPLLKKEIRNQSVYIILYYLSVNLTLCAEKQYIHFTQLILLLTCMQTVSH